MQQNTVQLCVRDESELYNHLDPSRERLSDEVYIYLKAHCIECAHTHSRIDKIQIISDAPVDGDRFKESICHAVKREQDAFDWQLKTNNKRALWEYIVGITLSVVGFLLAFFLDKVLLAVVTFFGSMLLREAVIIGTKLNPDILYLKRLLDPLLACEVEVIPNTEN